MFIEIILLFLSFYLQYSNKDSDHVKKNYYKYLNWKNAVNIEKS